ncbi:MAG: hypothetical protein NC920_02935 [Candidatus Omnitrophica bacterium]|nr:hypothetical protein [Candidatus Omnitrophota bacterium]
MDKVRFSFLWILVVISWLAVVFYGCATLKGISQGVALTCQGITDDSKNLWQSLLKADKWIRENLW